MLLVRPVAANDLPALEALAAVATPGVHTLPRSRSTLERALERSLASFDASPDFPGDEAYMFVLEQDGQIAGTASILATAGASGTFFAFRNDVLHQVSRDLNISHSVHALTLCSDLTSHSQLASFFLRERNGGREPAALLSRARLLFAAAAPQRFAEKFFSSMAGITDADGRSAFWEALGRKFFKMDFLQAERLIEGARNRTLIVELMPHYPVYVPLLPGDAQAAMGQVHPEGELPFSLLSNEGFEPDEYVDIFDGGPILRAHKAAIHSIAQARTARVGAAQAADRRCLIAVAEDGRFRATVADCRLDEMRETLSVDEEVRRALGVMDGDAVLCVDL